MKFFYDFGDDYFYFPQSHNRYEPVSAYIEEFWDTSLGGFGITFFDVFLRAGQEEINDGPFL